LDKHSKIIIGTAALSGNYGHVPEENILETLSHSYEKNFKEFDTGPNYGNGAMESYLGNVFRKKDDVKISTKIGNLSSGGKDFSIDSMRKSFSQSLKRLKRNEIETLFLHNPRDEIKNYENVDKFLNELYKEGKIRSKGISLARGYNYKNSILKIFNIIQDDYNLLRLEFPEISTPEQMFVARSPFATGLLSGNVNSESKFTDPYRSQWLKGERLRSLIKRIEKLKEISDIPLPEMAVRYVLYQNGIDKIIFGVKEVKHVDYITYCLRKGPLSASLKNNIQELYDDDFRLVNERNFKY